MNTRKTQWQAIVDYIQKLELEKKIEKSILAEVRNCFYFQNKHGNGKRSNVELVYKLLDIFTAYNEPETAGMVLYINYQSIKETLERYWKSNWENENTLTWVAQQGALLGSIKCQEDINRNTNKISTMQADKKRINNQIALFSNNEFLKEKTTDPCIICFEDLLDVVVTPCRHIFCLGCTKQLSNNLKNNFSCPECRTPVQCDTLNITTVDIINGQAKETANEPSPSKEVKNIKDLTKLEKKFGTEWRATCTNKYGSKMTRLVEYLHDLFDASAQNRVIIFSQYDKMLKMIGKTLDEFKIKYVYCHGNNFVLNKNINRFKKDDSIRVIMLSSETSNSGSNLTEANYIILIEPLYHELQQVKAIEQQIIGRAVRLGQKLPVKVVRFITRNTIENEHFEKNRYDLNTLQE
jgi:SNF2 family DNA or RNA helicase